MIRRVCPDVTLSEVRIASGQSDRVEVYLRDQIPVRSGLHFGSVAVPFECGRRSELARTQSRPAFANSCLARCSCNYAVASTTTRGYSSSFDVKLENEEEILDAIVSDRRRRRTQARCPEIWQDLHNAAVRDDRVWSSRSPTSRSHKSASCERSCRAIQAELYYRAATFFGDVLGDEFGATTYLEKALAVFRGTPVRSARIDAQLTRIDDNKKLAEL